MQLVGSKVIHKIFGSGVIIDYAGRYITVSFAAGDKKFVFPNAFRTSMHAADPLLACEIEKLFVQQTPESETGVLTPQYFWVFQNRTFSQEAQGGYLWAPKTNATGHEIAHWKLLKSVCPGDIIFHSVNKQIAAISVACARCYSCGLPDELRYQKPWIDQGWRLDTRYVLCRHPVCTSEYIDTLRSLQPAKHGPFNVRGRDNSGYLFYSNKELSQFLYDRLLPLNPELRCYTHLFGLEDDKK